MRVLVATDAWHPQVNGVVRTYERLAVEAGRKAFRAGRIPAKLYATASSPLDGTIR